MLPASFLEVLAGLWTAVLLLLCPLRCLGPFFLLNGRSLLPGLLPGCRPPPMLRALLKLLIGLKGSHLHRARHQSQCVGSISSPGSRYPARSPASRADGALSPGTRPLLASVTVPAPARVVGTGGIASQHLRRHVAPAAASTTVTADGRQYGRPAALPPAPAWRPSSFRSSNSLAASMLMPPTIPAPGKRSLLISNILTDSDSDASGGPAAAFPTAPSARQPSVRKKMPSLKARQAAEGVDDAAPQRRHVCDDDFLPT